MIMEIVIERKNVVDRLRKVTAHLGMKLAAPELLAATADDDVKVDVMYSASLVELLNVMLPYASLVRGKDSDTFILDVPSNWKSAQAGALSAFCEEFVSVSLVARWLDFVKSDSASLYRVLNKENASAITHILLLRDKPLR